MSVGTIKKRITSKGNTTKTKKKGFDPEDDNEADSLALLDYVLVKYGTGK
ncbi:MAG TPA: hypothetical protein LFW21_00090 [Rickettsia endosymbiont of Pyrocoelia pectoralis]|nr:hypothetical protein [Rickettsia endosymbiont of Pyrocoelia pectoralis]